MLYYKKIIFALCPDVIRAFVLTLIKHAYAVVSLVDTIFIQLQL